ncbi:MAG: tetratricopeptide repeat protein [Phycisphaeraceae bacterium]|nr:tetratricopeptide repeat protein [Phycisphaeraceae bacterium]
MANQHALDMVIGTGEAQRNAKVAEQHNVVAKKALEAGDRETAIVEFRKAVAADPTFPGVLFHLAFQLDLAGEEDEAIEMYERCCEIPPAPLNALINLAVLYEDRGDLVRAERCLRQVLETRPNHERAKLFMKDVLASKGMVIDDDGEKDRTKRSAMLDVPVTDFELSVRARTCLKKMNIRTLGDLLRTTEAELLSYKNFGESSLVEIKQMLSTKGLRLGQGSEDAYRASRRRMLDTLKGSGKEVALEKPVSEMNLSVRARKALQLLNIQTLGDLMSHTEAELMGVKNFGATSLNEVKEKLVEFGLALRTLDDE